MPSCLWVHLAWASCWCEGVSGHVFGQCCARNCTQSLFQHSLRCLPCRFLHMYGEAGLPLPALSRARAAALPFSLAPYRTPSLRPEPHILITDPTCYVNPTSPLSKAPGGAFRFEMYPIWMLVPTTRWTKDFARGDPTPPQRIPQLRAHPNKVPQMTNEAQMKNFQLLSPESSRNRTS
jgi:hypothetical protein